MPLGDMNLKPESVSNDPRVRQIIRGLICENLAILHGESSQEIRQLIDHCPDALKDRKFMRESWKRAFQSQD